MCTLTFLFRIDSKHIMTVIQNFHQCLKFSKILFFLLVLIFICAHEPHFAAFCFFLKNVCNFCATWLQITCKIIKKIPSILYIKFVGYTVYTHKWHTKIIIFAFIIVFSCFWLLYAYFSAKIHYFQWIKNFKKKNYFMCLVCGFTS